MGDLLHRNVVVNDKQVYCEQKIGEGGFALVYKANDMSGHVYALKRVIVGRKGEGDLQARTEIDVLSRVGECKALLKFVGATRRQLASGVEYMILTELCRGGSVGDALQDTITAFERAMSGGVVGRVKNTLGMGAAAEVPQPVLLPGEVIVVTATIAAALHALHAAGITHRDIKAQNVLMRPDPNALPPAALARPPAAGTSVIPAIAVPATRRLIGACRMGDMCLCDFGSSTTESYEDGEALWSSAPAAKVLSKINARTTPAFRAPELVDQFARLPVTNKQDIWALGVTIYQLAFGSTPFGESSLGAVQGRYSVPDNADSRIVHLLKMCFVRDPAARATASDILEYLATLGVPVDKYLSGSVIPSAKATEKTVQPETQANPWDAFTSPATAPAAAAPVAPGPAAQVKAVDVVEAGDRDGAAVEAPRDVWSTFTETHSAMKTRLPGAMGGNGAALMGAPEAQGTPSTAGNAMAAAVDLFSAFCTAPAAVTPATAPVPVPAPAPAPTDALSLFGITSAPTATASTMSLFSAPAPAPTPVAAPAPMIPGTRRRTQEAVHIDISSLL